MLIAIIATAIVTAIATNEISTSSDATKKTISASKSQIVSKLTANPLVPAKIASSASSPLKHQAISSLKSLSTSPLLIYRAISPSSLEY